MRYFKEISILMLIFLLGIGLKYSNIQEIQTIAVLWIAFPVGYLVGRFVRHWF